MAIVLDGTNGITTPDLESSGPVTGTTASFSGNVTLGTSVLATPTGSAPSYTCRAWVNFNGTGTVAIRASGNVSSITDVGVGQYRMNFSTAMPDVDFALCGVANRSVNFNALVTAGNNPQTTYANIAVIQSSNEALTDASLATYAVFR